jgi:hypothetical protein
MVNSGPSLEIEHMVNYSEPVLWEIPTWHPDYGDVKAELEHLRNLANIVIQQIPQLSVGLSVPEVGVMFLLIATDNKVVLAEIYSIHQSNGGINLRKYGIFLHPNSSAEEEHYTPSTRDVIDLLKSR